MLTSNTDDFECYFIIEKKTCTTRYIPIQFFGSTHLKVQRWQFFSNPDTCSQFFFRLVILRPQTLVKMGLQTNKNLSRKSVQSLRLAAR